MKKYFVLLTVVLFVLAGCSNPAEKGKTPGPAKPGRQQTQYGQQLPPKGQKKYYIGAESPVRGIGAYVDKYRPYTGVFMQKMDGYRVVLISMGEKFSEGYKVRVERVIETEDTWKIAASFTEPQSEDYAGKSTFPCEAVCVIDDGKPVEVVNRTNAGEKKMEIIEIPEGRTLPTSKSFIVFSPLEGDKLTGPVLIKGKARVFEATFRITVEDGHFRLAQKTVMANEGAPGWGYFETRLPFDKPTNPQGFVIFSYENMENGSMIEELTVPVKFQD